MSELKPCPFGVTGEMQKLRDWLDAHKIEWEDRSITVGDAWVCRTHFWYKDYLWSIIHGYGSYGGFSPYAKDTGLLELCCSAVNGGEPVGWLTAKTIIKYLTGGIRNDKNGMCKRAYRKLDGACRKH